jgi:hypothetical protein
MGGVQVTLVFLDLDSHRHDIIIELAISGDFLGKAPIPGVGHSLLQDLKVTAWAGEHVSEPCWEGFEGRVNTVVGGGV